MFVTYKYLVYVWSQVAQRLGNRASNLKVASTISCTYCKSLWIRASAKWQHVNVYRELHPDLMESMTKKGSNTPEKPRTPQQLWYNHEKKALLKTHPDVSHCLHDDYLALAKEPCIHCLCLPRRLFNTDKGTLHSLLSAVYNLSTSQYWFLSMAGDHQRH